MTNAVPDAADSGLINTIDELHTALDESSQSGTELGRYLLQHQQLTPAQLESALAIKSANPDRRLGEILVEQKALSAEALTMAHQSSDGRAVSSARQLSARSHG
jgi:hypothetical protein